MPYVFIIMQLISLQARSIDLKWYKKPWKQKTHLFPTFLFKNYLKKTFLLRLRVFFTFFLNVNTYLIYIKSIAFNSLFCLLKLCFLISFELFPLNYLSVGALFTSPFSLLIAILKQRYWLLKYITLLAFLKKNQRLFPIKVFCKTFS